MKTEQSDGALLHEYLSEHYQIEELAKELGYNTRQGLYYQLKKSPMSKDFTHRLEEILHLDIDSILKKPQKHITGDELRRQKSTGTDNDEGLIYVPIAAQAGYSRNFLDPVYIGQLERLYVPGLPYKGDNYRYFEVEGDSMEPTLEEGMQVIAQIMEFEGWKSIGEQWNNINDFYIHVIVTINQVLIKRLYKKDDETFVMISDNEDMYPQQPIKKESIKELWIVKRKLDWRMVPPKMFEKKI